MKKINEINEKLITVLEEKIQLLEEQKAINEKIIEIQKEQLFLYDVGSNNYKYKKAFDLAMKYLGTTVLGMEQSKESEENWVKLKNFIKKENLK